MAWHRFRVLRDDVTEVSWHQEALEVEHGHVVVPEEAVAGMLAAEELRGLLAYAGVLGQEQEQDQSGNYSEHHEMPPPGEDPPIFVGGPTEPLPPPPQVLHGDVATQPPVPAAEAMR